MTNQERHPELRQALRDLFKRFPDEYFRKIDDARAYPEACVDALTRAGWLAVMIPQEYGGAGLGLAEASVVMEEVNRCGGTPAPATARCITWAPCCATARKHKSASTCPASPAAIYVCSPWA